MEMGPEHPPSLSSSGLRSTPRSGQKPRASRAPDAPRPASASERTYAFTFSGSASEYFRIWIINVFLTVITLGIYNAWAKVRNRRYFYAHTTLDGHAFDYLANPIAILKGNVIVGAGLVQILLAQAFAPELSLVAISLFYLVIPYLVYKSLRFRTRNSTYRNIRFHFHGTLGESYRIYLFFPLLILLTLGLIIPYMTYWRKRYLFDHFAYGQNQSRFTGLARRFYVHYLVVVALSALIAVTTAAGSGIVSGLFSTPDGISQTVLSGLVLAGYLVFIVATAMIQRYLYVQFNNYCWNRTTLGNVRFLSTLRTWPLVWIQVTNLLAIICSLGLLIPWARIRRTRYLLEHIRLIVRGDLNQFATDQGTDDHAIGDVSADFFDVEVGL